MSITSKIPKKNLDELYEAVRTVLSKGIDFGGDSMSDYRDIDGKRGEFQNNHNAYRLTGKKCIKNKCSGDIIKSVVAGRSAHFCNKHQKLYE